MFVWLNLVQARWNRLLLTELLPQIWAGLLAQRAAIAAAAPSKGVAKGAGHQADAVYSIWPSIDRAAPKLKATARSCVEELASNAHAVMWCESAGKHVTLKARLPSLTTLSTCLTRARVRMCVCVCVCVCVCACAIHGALSFWPNFTSDLVRMCMGNSRRCGLMLATPTAALASLRRLSGIAN